VVTHAPDLVAPRGGVARVSSPSSRSWLLEAVLLGFLVAATAIVYASIHRRLAIDANVAYARLGPYAASIHPARDSIIFTFGPFLAAVLGSTVLAALRHRIAAFGVFALTACTPLMQSVLGVLPADRGFYASVGPNPLGGNWTSGVSRPALGQLWRACAIDYSLALLPAVAIVAWSLHGEPRGRTRLRLPTTSEATGVACSTFLFWLALHTWELRETLRGSIAPGTGTDLVAFLPFFLLGAVLARGSRWRFVALAGVPILWATTWIPHLLVGDRHGFDPSDGHNVLPFVAVVAAGALWHPIASVLRTETSRPWVLVGVLNALNLADVAFTSVALRSGQAVEANPVAAWIGPGAKIAAVGVASVLLARFRPRALVWLVLALAAVVAWHVSGLVLDAA
jgi:hypothetical protein